MPVETILSDLTGFPTTIYDLKTLLENDLYDLLKYAFKNKFIVGVRNVTGQNLEYEFPFESGYCYNILSCEKLNLEVEQFDEQSNHSLVRDGEQTVQFEKYGDSCRNNENNYSKLNLINKNQNQNSQHNHSVESVKESDEDIGSSNDEMAELEENMSIEHDGSLKSVTDSDQSVTNQKNDL